MLSGNGRFVAFRSAASNLVPSDFNGISDVFVRDMLQGTAVRASVAFDGTDPGQRAMVQAKRGKSGVNATPRFATARMQAQQSMFTLANSIDQDHGALIAEAVPTADRLLLKVPAGLKGNILQRLLRMNMHAGTLFPGLDGVARRIGDLTRWRIR